MWLKNGKVSDLFWRKQDLGSDDKFSKYDANYESVVASQQNSDTKNQAPCQENLKFMAQIYSVRIS